MTAIASRTVRFHSYGEPLDVLRQESAEVPDPPAGRVRIRVTAVGLNPADWELCRGFAAGSLPRGIGFDVAGVVESVGEGVDDVIAGDRVLGTADFVGQPTAGAADVAILDAWTPAPSDLDDTHAATLPMVAITAAWTLEAMGVGPDTTLAVHGGGSMVGFGAVQIARRLGARVITTAGSSYTADLEGFGASVTPYGEGMVERVRRLADGSVDLVLDAAPPHAGIIPALVELTGEAAHVVTISNHDEARGLGARSNLNLLASGSPRPVPDILRQYASLMAEGSFRLPIARTLTLDDWREAAELSMSRRARGKIVLLP